MQSLHKGSTLARIFVPVLATMLLLMFPDSSCAAKERPWRQWPEINPWAQDKPSGRTQHAMVTGADGCIWIFGGNDGHLSNSLFKLDTQTKSWTTIKTFEPFPSARRAHSMATIDSNIWMFGGFTQGDGRSLTFSRFSLLPDF